ncbi:DUF2339 domain-containing protein [Thioclava pacifica]|uniref:DUF2339 domain-containing protein n=1 Tax=Thioclava pacifica DSM 10166 TaxID=1353537 RepID=A0A074J362_9RHOB|nr:DUF2339 domain-containing protein [Thioclava pacifica]KEO50954.1 hypothetical protein TP2_13780 [Thioclava pacifica DSM 10166]
MFLLGLIGVIYGLLVLIGLPYALITIRNLKDRIAALEARQEGGGVMAAPETSESEATEPPPIPAPAARAEKTEGPWQSAQTKSPPLPAEPISPAPEPQQAYVLRAENFARLGDWLRANWTLAVAALSLIFGGLFMVQYGVERGLLTPPLRVIGALILGLALVGGGEWLRRKFGDVSTPSTKHLPSIFAGAGVVVIFIALLAANALYALIGPGTAIGGIAVVAAGAVLMGWLYGAVLPAVGLLGAAAAPFLVSASDTDATPFYAYFAIIGLAGLAIDSFRRWAWVSALALALACAGLTLVHLDVGSAPGLIGAAFSLGIGALIMPERRLVPVLDGVPPLPARAGQRPGFPTLLGATGVLIASFGSSVIAFAPGSNPTEFALGMGALMVVFLAITFWLYRAPALDLTIALPGLLFLTALAAQARGHGEIYQAFRAFIDAPPETPMPSTLWWLMGAAGLMAAAATWRLNLIATRPEPDAPVPAHAHALPWALAAAAIVPASALVIEFLWNPRDVIGNYAWALAAMAGAAMMVLLAQRRGARAGASRQRDLGLLAAAAILMISLAFFLLLTKAALTLALALLMVLASLIDRRFDLRVLSWVAQLGAAVIGYRLLIDPGLFYAIERASWAEFALSYLGAMAGFEATRRIARKDRPMLVAVAESALLSTLAMTLTLTIIRYVDLDGENFWLPGLCATSWAAVGLAQVWRIAPSSGAVRVIRAVFAGVSGIIATGLAAIEIGAVSWMANTPTGIAVNGPPVFDGLALAFVPLALTLSLGAWAMGRRTDRLARILRLALIPGAAVLTLIWGFFEIRRLWRGPDLSVPGPSDGELYSYTLAMLLVSLGMLAIAVMRRSELLRRLAMGGVALTIVKVFLLDMSGLSGLTRVASFVGLGLALAGLAWINRKIDAHWRKE